MAAMASLLIFLLLLLHPLPSISQSPPPPPPAQTFSPPPALLSTLRSTLDEIKTVVSIISTFGGGGIGGILGGGSNLLLSAVADCLDLLDLSSDEISTSLSPARASDLQTWLSAALGNQDTCRDSLAGTNSLLGSLAGAGLSSVTSLIADALSQVTAGNSNNNGNNHRRLNTPHQETAVPTELPYKGGFRSDVFPRWVDRRLLAASGVGPVDAVVAKDGSGNYTTVKAAVAAAPEESGRRYVIYVKRGVYKETVEVKKNKWNVMLVGDGAGATVISGGRSFVDGWTTYRSATVAVVGKRFIARDLTIENTAGAAKHQAVALRVDSDFSVFYRCEFIGFQDTLYAHSLRQFYRDCRISGTVDFVFGNAAAVFQNCSLNARLPLSEQKNSVTAHGRTDPNQNTGFSFQFCNVSADSDLASASTTAAVQTYLGRPWKEYSRVVFMQSYIDSVIKPEGWLAWNDSFALSTLYFGEYMNSGPGAGLAARVRWPGFHAMTSSAEAANFTVSRFIDGNLWLPATGVKFTDGFSA